MPLIVTLADGEDYYFAHDGTGTSGDPYIPKKAIASMPGLLSVGGASGSAGSTGLMVAGRDGDGVARHIACDPSGNLAVVNASPIEISGTLSAQLVAGDGTTIVGGVKDAGFSDEVTRHALVTSDASAGVDITTADSTAGTKYQIVDGYISSPSDCIFTIKDDEGNDVLGPIELGAKIPFPISPRSRGLVATAAESKLELHTTTSVVMRCEIYTVEVA